MPIDFKQAQAKLTTLARRASFYTRRMRGEKVTKQIVTLVAAFALVLQLTGGIFPFASTNVNAIGDDNLVRNGVTSKEELLAIYDSGSDGAGHNDIKQIYTHFGVSRQDLVNATMGSYKTNDFNGQIKSVGRTDFTGTGRTAVAIEGTDTTVYTGPYLDNANSKAFVMPALIGKRSVDGQWFAITLDCGNVVYTVTPPPLPKPVPAACDSLTVTKMSRTNFKFTTKYSLGSDKLKSVTYVVSDASGKEVSRSTSASYAQMTAGTYSVKAFINVTDSAGSAKTITSDECAAMFTVVPPATPSSTVPPKCTIVGKEDLPATSPDCKETPVTDMCKVVGKENLPKDSPDCVAVVPTTPTTLPKTGLGDDILKVAGIGSIIASVGYYVASRRGLLAALMNR